MHMHVILFSMLFFGVCNLNYDVFKIENLQLMRQKVCHQYKADFSKELVGKILTVQNQII